MSPPTPTPHGRPERFATTRWSLVLAAADRDGTGAEDALASLCETYWYPLYAFLRRSGHAPPEAEDLVQGFFATLLEKQYLADVDRERGRFRSFLLTAIRHYASKQRDRARARKRGGDRRRLSIDLGDAERRYRIEPFHDLTPERLFERNWAHTVLARVLDRLRTEYADRGQVVRFERLSPYLTGTAATSTYAEAGADIGLSEEAVKVAVSRLRKRFGTLLRAEIAETVATHGDVDEELRTLFAALRGASAGR